MKKNNKKLRSKNINIGSLMQIHGKIFITEHCIERYAERLKMNLVEPTNLKDKKTEITKNEVIRKVINEVKRSVLIGLRNGQDERIFRGNKYIIEWDPVNRQNTVITMLISEVTQKEIFNDKFNDEIDPSKFRKVQTA